MSARRAEPVANVQNRGPFDAFNNDVSDPAYHPSLTSPDGGTYGLPLETAHMKSPATENDGDWWGASANTKYITPSIGGRPGTAHAFGWTTGIKPRRERRQAFDGRTLVVPNVPLKAIGQVGRDNRLSRLATGVSALNTDYLPTQDAINASFVTPGPANNPLLRDMIAGGT